MSAEEKNKLDELFKSGLDVPDTHFEYNDQDWDDLEELMGDRKRPRIIAFWLPVLSGVAALLLLVLGWWFFKPAPIDTQQVAINKKPVTQAPVNNSNGTATKADSANGLAVHTTAPQQVKQEFAKQKPAYTKVLHSPPHYFAIVDPSVTKQPVSDNNKVAPVNPVQQNNPEVIANNTSPKNNAVNTENTVNSATSGNTDNANAKVIAKVTDEPATSVANEKPKKVKTVISGHKGPQFGLAMLLSPDINGAGSFQDAKVGTNIGLLFSVSIKKLTISTGAAYAKKPYLTKFDNYYTAYKFKTDPQQVSADCRVLDIPLNIDYQVYHKSKNSFSIGTGLSSYIMLKETYNYDYAVPGTTGPSSVTFINRHQHILGVLNLDATYAHQLNDKFSIAAQPYLKIPLTDIGNSRVKLQSAGVAVGLRWNINK
ncbi:hypothetical protein [Mucilaginibacter boryungensis]|uniref:Outer membrane protein with beta-barrel domain n=1 Tax=Mucilaginibacter boryungensis TaxID=768480 RepID=A0ABR9XGN2_9SPHI|nr:hypothetical protein [Mucilaginibacter boryungensis]MBE9666365.1 hypothetical protein [Mucilaginibacter boryungensis]